MLFEFELIIIIAMVGTVLLLNLGLRLPSSVAMIAGAVVGSIVAGEGVAVRHIFEGCFAFLDTSDVESRQYLVYHFWQAVAYFIAPVFTIAVTHVGYVFGLKNKKIFGFVGAKKKDK